MRPGAGSLEEQSWKLFQGFARRIFEQYGVATRLRKTKKQQELFKVNQPGGFNDE